MGCRRQDTTRFNSRARIRRDSQDLPQGLKFKRSFNSRARIRRDSFGLPDISRRILFQFTRPHKARPPSWLGWSYHLPRFNSRARIRRDDRKTRLMSPMQSFNSRARIRRDIAVVSDQARFGAFQFTRPHKARRAGPARAGRNLSFNSRARIRRDPCPRTGHIWPAPFQFTRPHKARPARLVPARRARGRFNSRARIRRDRSSIG